MLFLFILVFYIYRLTTLDKECRMLQLNHYQISRSIEYLKHSMVFTKRQLIKMIIHLPFLFLFFIKANQLEILIIMLLVYLYVAFKIKPKKLVHLQYTNRILRLYVCIFLLYFCIFEYLYETPFFLLGVIIVMMMNGNIVFLASLIIYPLEKGIRNMYVYKAKRVLNENKNLIKIGIVGSYGKTSAKNIIHALLLKDYYCLKSKKSYNNLMGNSLTIRNELKKIHELFISEMGSDHVGEIKQLMNFIVPSYVMITSIGNQHLETFKTQENIIKEKMSPLHYLQKDDIAFLNIDNSFIYDHRFLGDCRKVYFGEHQDAHYRIKNIRIYEWGSRFTIVHHQKEMVLETKLLGYYNIINICGSVALAHTLGVSFDNIKDALLRLQPVEHRLQSIQKENYTLIDNAYNSNVLSFRNSLSVLSKIDKYRIFITPGLLDLKDNQRINNTLMDEINGKADEVLIVGHLNREAMLAGLKRNHYQDYHLMDTMEDALRYVERLDRKDFVVLIENDIDKDLMNR